MVGRSLIAGLAVLVAAFVVFVLFGQNGEASRCGTYVTTWFGMKLCA